MLKRANRLKKRYQFNYIYREGTRVSGRAVQLWCTTSRTKQIKVGFAISKKLGHAVVRNKIKRRLREIMFAEIPNLKQNFNLIVAAKESILSFSFDEISQEIHQLLFKAGLFNEKNL